MLGPVTRASSKLKLGLKAIDSLGSHQNGKHLLGPSPGGNIAREDASYDSETEEEAIMMEVLAEELGSENEDEMKEEAKVEASDPFEYETQEEGLGRGSITRPTSLCFPGLSTGGEGAIIKKFFNRRRREVGRGRETIGVRGGALRGAAETSSTEPDEIRARQALARGNFVYLSGFSDWWYSGVEIFKFAVARCPRVSWAMLSEELLTRC